MISQSSTDTVPALMSGVDSSSVWAIPSSASGNNNIHLMNFASFFTGQQVGFSSTTTTSESNLGVLANATVNNDGYSGQQLYRS